MRDIHPFLVLSPRNFNDKTSLVIGLPMTTAEYNADNPFAVATGKVKRDGRAGKTSYVLCHQPVLTHELKDGQLWPSSYLPMGGFSRFLFRQAFFQALRHDLN